MKTMTLMFAAMMLIACHHEKDGNTCDNDPSMCMEAPTPHHNWLGTYTLVSADDMASNTFTQLDSGILCVDPGGCGSFDLGVNNDDMTSSSSPDLAKNSCPDMSSSNNGCDGVIVRLDSGQVGIVGASVSTNDLTITITSWTQKTDEAGSYCGFSYTTNGSGTLASYQVKGGTQVFDGYDSPWANPYGCQGSTVHGVSHIDFCVW